ncbi:MAG TPA: ABC transporter ATP-binding protein, partial [Vicinamibacterales bacterium]|nr:ABC transporter ATP-binding protein [Vicinamibacterales bacterium]
MSAEGAALRRSAPPAGPFGRGPMAGFGMPVQKARDFKGTLRRLAGYVAPHRVSIAVVLAAGVLSTVFSVLGPKLIGMATTTIFEGYLARRLGGGIDWNALGGIVRTLLVLYVTSALFQYLQQYVMSGVAQRTVYALRQDVEAKFSRLPLRFFDLKTHGEILSRAVNDLDNISSTLQQNLTQLITSVLSVIGIIIMMLTISVVLTLVVVLTLPVSVLVVTRIARRSQGFFVRQQQALGELNGHVAEMYSGHAIVSAFGHEARAIARFGELNEKYYDSAWRAQFVTGIMFPVTMFVGNLGYVAVAVMGGYLVTRRAIAIGDVQAFIQYSRQFTMPISQLSSIANTVQLTIASAERVFELLDEAEEPADSPRAAIPAPRGAVRFEDVAFRYKPEVPLIEEMNLTVTPGQTIAIVGPTGAGKTTLVNLMMRFYDVSSGAIRVDGVDIRDLARGDLRRVFGMVLQDTWLFSGTIRDNIAYGR